MKLLSAEKMRELEKRADASGNTFAAMMERAGTLTAQAIIERWQVQERRVLVLVGPGNNGGDGLVSARVLRDAGARVHLYVWKREPSDEDVNWRSCRGRGIEFARAEQDPGLANLKQEIAGADFIVDAFLGTGVARPIEGLLKEILETVKEALEGARADSRELVSPSRPFPLSPSPRVPVSLSLPIIIAVDLPSGLNPDTGGLDPAAVAADLTVTFAFPKLGHYAFPGAGAVGELVVADIGIQREWAKDLPLDLATPEEIRTRLPARPRDSNKGTFGKALLACGSLEFTGAPRLAAAAAGRVGAGLVTLAVPRTIYPIVSANLDEATYLPLPDAGGAWSPRAARLLVEHARNYEALLLGCGFGRAESTRQFVARLFGAGRTTRQKIPRVGTPRESRRESEAPLPSLVIDADALNALAEIEDWWKQGQFSAPPILTPHPGEMARLIGSTVTAVQEDRVGIASRYARKWNAIVVLKGAFTVIAQPDGNAMLIPFATPALATAGTGDVLAGAIVGTLAQYRAASIKSGHGGAGPAAQDAFNAALVGAYVHALAGDIAGDEIGAAGVVAGDLVPRLPEAIRRVRGKQVDGETGRHGDAEVGGRVPMTNASGD